MGYLVGGKCYDKSLAYDYYMSAVSPVIAPNGSFIQPVKRGNDWYIGTGKVDLFLPQCSPSAGLDLGVSLGYKFVIVLVAAWSVRIIYKLITR